MSIRTTVLYLVFRERRNIFHNIGSIQISFSCILSVITNKKEFCNLSKRIGIYVFHKQVTRNIGVNKSKGIGFPINLIIIGYSEV